MTLLDKSRGAVDIENRKNCVLVMESITAPSKQGSLRSARIQIIFNMPKPSRNNCFFMLYLITLTTESALRGQPTKNKTSNYITISARLQK